MSSIPQQQQRWFRIVEIGNDHRFKRSYPDQTQLIATGLRDWPAGIPHRRSTPSVLFDLARQISRGEVDLIVCYPPLYAPWESRSFLKVLQKWHLLFAWGLFISFGPTLLRWFKKVPIAVVDLEDSFAIGGHNFFLMDRCVFYFKRELPVDMWQVFFATAHRKLPTARSRRSDRLRRRIARLKPISYGVGEPQQILDIASRQSVKTVDVFFAGDSHASSTVRSSGIEQIRSLAELGYKVDAPTDRLTHEQYLSRCARAWLTWSPEGLGWDCGRHYEAPLCGSVPIINYPTIHRHKPLVHGVHCFYYGVEGDDLRQTIVRALADKSRLKTMADAARRHVLEHHTHEKLCEYVLKACLPGWAGTSLIDGASMSVQKPGQLT